MNKNQENAGLAPAFFCENPEAGAVKPGMDEK